ncbi:MAG: hypothetical protein Q9163_004940 [Psora crenata]
MYRCSSTTALIFLTLHLGTVANAQTTGGAADGLASASMPSVSMASSVEIGGTPTIFREIFTVPSNADAGANLIPNIEDPQAVDAQIVCPGYTASNVVRNDLGFVATLTLAGQACNVYGNDIETLNLTVQYQSSDRLAIRISPAVIDASNESYYILPNYLVTQPTADVDANNTSLENDLSFTWSNDPTFSFSVYRVSTGDSLLSTAGTKLIYEDQFIEFASALPDNYNLYGLGETIHDLRLGNNLTRTMYNADVGDPIDENIYGTHPFYLDTRYYEVDPDTGNFSLVTSNATNATANYVSYSHGVYNRNSHGQEVLLRPTNITWRLLGGSIDLYVFAGPTQPEVTKAYQMSAVGLPAMQQYFTFGYHQCRWGYANWSQLQEVVDNYEAFGIPLENIWTDIDYMNQYRDFDNDPIRYSYSEAETFLTNLHNSGRHYIPIIDSAIYVPNPQNASDNYTTFNNGNDMGAFMKNPDGSLYIGTVWPGYTVFPDWISGGAGQWWADEMTSWHSKIAFDGAWIDMSEAASFCVGSCGSPNVTMNPVHPPFSLPGEPGNVIYSYPEGFNLTNATEAAVASSLSARQASAYPTSSAVLAAASDYLRTAPTSGLRDINHPPYVVNNIQGDLAVHALSPNATHADGTADYDIHNLWGHQILNATYYALLSAIPDRRPFIIGRSTFAGSGKWAGHWGGDNTSLFAYMYFSISQALSFSLFGIPMFGVDTCGFNGNTDEELCNRWMQLSAFFPFYRNHNTLSANPQEAYVWASVAEASRTAMQIRYSLLPYMYTLFYLAHTTGSTVMRALAWEFPREPLLAGVDNQFFLGPAILVTPVLAQGADSVKGVFPGAGKGEVYYDWYNKSTIFEQPGQNVTIDAPLGHIPVFVRGGYVLPLQEPAMVTRDARTNPWGVIVALSLEGRANGRLYVDDGESLVQNATLFVEFTAADSALHASPRGMYNDTNPLANVTVLGVQDPVHNVTLNGMTIPRTGVDYNATTKALVVSGLRNMTSSGAWAAEWVLRWS